MYLWRGANGPNGGDTVTNFVGSANGSIGAIVTSYGGRGGYVYDGGNAGNGGSSKATGDIIVSNPSISGYSSLLSLDARGGDGGYANSAGSRGGDGGEGQVSVLSLRGRISKFLR